MLEAGPIQTQRLVREYLEKRRFMEAMIVAKKGLAHFPTMVEFRLLLAETYALDGKPGSAREQLEAALREHPGDARVLEALGRL